nr:MAG TPA: hypothetical protein [Caudoviricetes sp.]
MTKDGNTDVKIPDLISQIKDKQKEQEEERNEFHFEKAINLAKKRTRDEAIEDNTCRYIDAATEVAIWLSKKAAILLFVLSCLWILSFFEGFNNILPALGLRENIEKLFSTVIPPVIAFIVGHTCKK